MVIEDDAAFARLIMDLARDKGFKAIVALNADKAVRLVRQYSPAAMTLDLRLPDGDGWALLDQFKQDPATAHVPVHIISVEEQEERGLRMGALGYLTKPVTKESLEAVLDRTKEFLSRPVKNLLVVDDDEKERLAIAVVIGNGDVRTTAVATGEEALAALEKQHFDCAVVDLKLPGMSGMELIRRIRQISAFATLPIIIYTGKELTRKEETELRRFSEAIVIQDVKSPERLLDETALFLHRVRTKLPEAKRKMIVQVRQVDPVLAGKKVLRDIMMPEMDGWECIRRMRAQDKFTKLPILAVTAKAMKGDREKCLAVGANDYIAKPVDVDQLRSLLRVWLYR